MKLLWIGAVLSAFLTVGATAQEIVSARWMPDTQDVELVVRHGGGCKEHTWGFDFQGGCYETYPAQCHATLTHTSGTGDFCEAYISTTSRVKIKSHPYDRYSLVIKGPENSKTISVMTAETPVPPATVTCKHFKKQANGNATPITVNIGDTVAALDGCNSCTCRAPGYMSCTELFCTQN